MRKHRKHKKPSKRVKERERIAIIPNFENTSATKVVGWGNKHTPQAPNPDGEEDECN